MKKAKVYKDLFIGECTCPWCHEDVDITWSEYDTMKAICPVCGEVFELYEFDE